MSTLFMGLILSLAGGVSAAVFASERNRNPAAWYVIGAVTGPIGTLILLLLRPMPERKFAFTQQGAILATLLVLAVIIAAGLGVAEVAKKYVEDQRFVELEAWDLYGDALIRMGDAKDNPSDSFVVKAARNQVAEHLENLQAGMRRTENHLILALRGERLAVGARGIIANGFRLLTLRSPQWPASVGISSDTQDRMIKDFQGRLETYRKYIEQIESAQRRWGIATVPDESVTP